MRPHHDRHIHRVDGQPPSSPPGEAPARERRQTVSAEDLAPTEAQKQAAAHVLWYFTREGYQPGSFTEKLLSAFGHADTFNLVKLTMAFPELGEAYRLAAHYEGGMDALRNRIKR